MALVGYSDLQARSAYQPTIHRHGRNRSRTSATTVAQPNPLTGMAEHNGTSIVDVTNPGAPVTSLTFPGRRPRRAGGAQMRASATAAPCHAPTEQGLSAALIRRLGHEIWDVTEPEKPSRLSFREGFRNTHKSFWECDTGIAYLVSGPTWRTDG